MAGLIDFGDYLLERRVGKGGMAEVFLAQRKRGGTDPICVKRMLAGSLDDERALAMFFDEGRLAQRLLHPNVVQVFDAGSVGGHPYLAMEYVEGPSLERLRRALHERQDLLPVEVCVDVGVQLCRALQYVHTLALDGVAQEVVHRDVSPANLLLKRDGTVKLADFGVARALDRVTETQAGLTKGKCPYMSPEQARAEAIDHRSDQFATGIVLWEMLTGRLLFDAGSAVASLQRVVSAPIPAPSSIRKSVPKALDDVVLRALERDRERRFADMAALEHALERTVPPLGVDDRESRLAAELERVLAGSGAAPAQGSPLVLPAGQRSAELEVERSLSEGSIEGVYRTAPQIVARAIPLEGATRTPQPARTSARARGRGGRRAALAIAIVMVLGALVGAALWRFPAEMRALPVVGALLESALFGEAPEASTPPILQPERVLPPRKRKTSPADDEKASRLEERAAALLLVQDHHGALPLLREAADLSPRRASLQRKLAMTYRALGERYLERRHLERYLSLAPRASDEEAARARLDELADER